jgi:hypothetical protein
MNLAALVAALTVGAQQGASSVPFDIAQLLQYGLLGLIFLCILFRKFLVPEWTLKQAEERNQKEVDDLQARLTETRQQLEKLQDVFQDQMIPVLTRATEVNARYIDEMKRARYRKNPGADDEE